MKLIIAGSRKFNRQLDARHTQRYIYQTINVEAQRFDQFPSHVISGGAHGIDTQGELWAKDKGVKIIRVLPEWDRYGKAAGPLRNQKMIEQGDALLALWDGESRGTFDIIKRALAEKVTLKVVFL